MSLIVRSNSVAGTSSAPSAGGSTKWLWAAVGALGVSVLALGATLIMQQRGNAPADASAGTPTAQQLAAGPQGQADPALVAGKGAAPVSAQAAQRNTAPARLASNQGGYGEPVAPYGQPQRVVSQAPVCSTCGRVESVQAVQQAAPATGVGAVAGGLIGHTKSDAMETVRHVINDQGSWWQPVDPSEQGVLDLLTERGVAWTDLDGWHRLDEHEIALGAPAERARVKVVDRDDMVAISRGEEVGR